MPSSWISIHPGFPPDAVAEIMPQARSRVVSFSEAIFDGQRSFTRWRATLFGLLILPISLGYLLLGRFFLGKLFFASDSCTSCELCAQHCPNQAIVMKGQQGSRRPYWTYHCESCMRCMAYCPTKAIEASHLFGVGAYLLAGAIPVGALLLWLGTLVPGLAFLSRIPRWVLQSVMPIMTIVAIYPLFHLALRVRWLNRFFTVATLTHYYRRYHEPETRLDDLD
jgi:Pyruvate/2-oxoacid:ferredoxin oxidoreductase delta subunit